MRKSRRASRKASRKGRRSSRRCWSGGSAPVNNASMSPMSAQSLAQGGDYLSLHKGQHGGSSCGAPLMRGGRAPPRSLYRTMTSARALRNIELASQQSRGAPRQRGGAAVSLASSAPVGYTGMLDDSLRGAARIAPLDHSIGAIQGMSDQAGGARRRRKGRKSTRRPSRRATRRVRMSLMKAMARLRKLSRKMRGGAAMHPADYGSPGMLLGPADEAKAMMGMNPEWKLASDPGAFAPKA
jgi:hypothetical protein